MPPPTFEKLLERASEICGVHAGFWDIWGKYHETPLEAKRSILRAKGFDATDAAALERSLAGYTRREWDPILPPSIVTGESDVLELPVSVRAEWLGETARFRIRAEDGSASEHQLTLRDLPALATAQIDGGTRVRKAARLPIRLPLGYHEVAVNVCGASAVCRVAVTPERAWTSEHLGRGGRAAGVAVSLYGLRSARNWGCGDFTDLRAVIDWVADELRGSFVALNPLHAIQNRRPFNQSPYLPNCVYYQNFIYLDAEAIEDFSHSRRAQQFRSCRATVAEIDELRLSQYVEYERVAALKLRFLKLLFLEFLRGRGRGEARWRDFEAFVAREGSLLEDFATFSALDEHLHRRDPEVWLWTQWPAEYQDPRSAATREFRRRYWRSVMFYQYLQWQIDIQLRAAQQHARNRRMGIGLYHDLALATDRFGCDLWADREFFVGGCRVGSPPDDFSPKGQDWGFPPPNAERHRADGYRLFAESIRKNCRHGGALRIDHVMRLFRLYWIPDDRDATEGAYINERNLDFLRILALESVRNRVVIVGEDLGTVEPEVRETLARFGILSYRLFYFEKTKTGGFRRPREYPEQSLVSSTTHDLPTIAGFWSGADIEARRQAGVIDEKGAHAALAARAEEKQKMLDALFDENLLPGHLPRKAADYPALTGDLHNAVIGFLATTPSQLLAINHEDLTKQTEQQNLPGTTWQYQNWANKMRYTVEELRTHETARSFAAMCRNWVSRSGRENPWGGH
jgi:4-alpha-glucanotransferase